MTPDELTTATTSRGSGCQSGQRCGDHLVDLDDRRFRRACRQRRRLRVHSLVSHPLRHVVDGRHAVTPCRTARRSRPRLGVDGRRSCCGRRGGGGGFSHRATASAHCRPAADRAEVWSGRSAAQRRAAGAASDRAGGVCAAGEGDHSGAISNGVGHRERLHFKPVVLVSRGTRWSHGPHRHRGVGCTGGDVRGGRCRQRRPTIAAGRLPHWRRAGGPAGRGRRGRHRHHRGHNGGYRDRLRRPAVAGIHWRQPADRRHLRADRCRHRATAGQGRGGVRRILDPVPRSGHHPKSDASPRAQREPLDMPYCEGYFDTRVHVERKGLETLLDQIPEEEA